MSVYLVTWDLNKEGLRYSMSRKNLIDVIEKLDSNYTTSLDSVRFISNTRTAHDLYEYLRSEARLDKNDAIFVTKIEKGTDNRQGDLGSKLWDWISARL
jgi:hypothetical protein